MFFEFVAEQALLVGALLSCIFLLLFHESRRGGQSLTPAQLSRKVNQDDALVLDVRDKAEFKGGHIVGALNIPFKDLEKRLSELGEDRSRPVIVVCKLGQHSGSAGKLLAAKGFEKLFRLGGGMLEWKAAQLPVVKA